MIKTILVDLTQVPDDTDIPIETRARITGPWHLKFEKMQMVELRHWLLQIEGISDVVINIQSESI